jgi:uncharacterized Tic20 family protein
MSTDPIPPQDPNLTPATGSPLGYAAPTGIETDPNARTWGMLAHLAALAGFIIPVGGHIIGPLVVWLIKKDEIPFVNDQGKESLNFQITVVIAELVTTPLVCTGVGVVVPLAIGICGVVFAIIAAIKANGGVFYRYPWALRLIK